MQRDGALDPYRPLWAVARSARTLLTSPDCATVKRCFAEGCDVLFLAKGSGAPRKWCSVACGGLHRSRKHYKSKVKPERAAFQREYGRYNLL